MQGFELQTTSIHAGRRIKEGKNNPTTVVNQSAEVAMSSPIVGGYQKRGERSREARMLFGWSIS